MPTNSAIFEPIIRTVVTFLVVLIIARILGRKQISQLTFFDYVAGTAIGSLSASAMSNSAISLATDIMCFITWTLLIISLHAVTLRSAPARKLLDEQPRVVIRNGKILEQSLVSSQYTVNDLLAELRKKEVFDPSKIDIGILETSGELSILKKAEHQSITTKDLNISCHLKNATARKYTGQELIVNGEVLYASLAEAGISAHWLKKQLEQQGITDITKLTTAVLTPSGKLYIDMKLDLL
jgi:uncharacterized membrane protein YcaP (DUF421 family)